MKGISRWLVGWLVQLITLLLFPDLIEIIITFCFKAQTAHTFCEQNAEFYFRAKVCAS
jgi:hypothetical protein